MSRSRRRSARPLVLIGQSVYRFLKYLAEALIWCVFKFIDLIFRLFLRLPRKSIFPLLAGICALFVLLSLTSNITYQPRSTTAGSNVADTPSANNHGQVSYNEPESSSCVDLTRTNLYQALSQIFATQNNTSAPKSIEYFNEINSKTSKPASSQYWPSEVNWSYYPLTMQQNEYISSMFDLAIEVESIPISDRIVSVSLVCLSKSLSDNFEDYANCIVEFMSNTSVDEIRSENNRTESFPNDEYEVEHNGFHYDLTYNYGKHDSINYSLDIYAE